MPNWCMNSLEITHKDPAMMQKALDAWNSSNFLQSLIPCPQPLIDTVAGSVGRLNGDPIADYKIDLHEVQMELNRKHFGYKDWYDWCVNEWGTKWDIGYRGEHGDKPALDCGVLKVGFDSAWSPPIQAYDKLTEMGYEIVAYYFEPGCDFCGKYYLGEDECYSASEMNFPEDIDAEMNISETLEMYKD